MSTEDYEWPETIDKDGNTNNGRCKGPCGLVRPLKDGLCRGCSQELFTDEDFEAMAMEGVQE